MVTNSLGNRNFMQPMGRLGLGGRGGFFSFFFVPNMFFTSSQWVPIRFSLCSLGSQCVSQVCSQQHLALILYVLPKVLPFSPIYLAQRVRHSIFMQKLQFWGASIVLTLFFCGFLGWAHFSNWLIAKKKKGWTCEAPPNN